MTANIPLRPEEMPGNRISKPEETPREKLKPVAQATRKTSIGSKVANFFAEDLRGVADYLIQDVILPATKDLIVDMVRQGIERTVYGESAPRSRRSFGPSSRGGSYTNYSRFSYSSPRRDPDIGPGDRREVSRRSRVNHDFSEIVVGSRGEALDILEGLDKQLGQFGVVTVADFYDLAGITAEFVDESWGWADLRSATVRQTRAGFICDLPRPVSLK